MDIESRISTLLDSATRRLKELSWCDRARLESEILLSHLLQKDRVYLHAHSNSSIECEDEFFKLIKRRELGEPIEYITGCVSFYGREFFVKKGALVPRPESEILIQKALELIELNSHIETICEVGAGSGALSITLALELKNIKDDIEIVATDISKDALEVANKNQKRYSTNIELIECDLLEKVDKKIDILISNPPYIKDSYKLTKNLEFEPKMALFGGERGLDIIERLIDEVYKREIELFICEMGYDQKSLVEEHLKGREFNSLCFYKDLSNLFRGFILKL